MYLLELQANDVHAALGRLLDLARVAGLKLAAVSAQTGAGADTGEYTIRASLDVADRDVVDRLACRIRAVVGVAAIEVRGECACAASTPSVVAP
jgi:acetolactate synthase regulatory subunit